MGGPSTCGSPPDDPGARCAGCPRGKRRSTEPGTDTGTGSASKEGEALSRRWAPALPQRRRGAWSPRAPEGLPLPLPLLPGKPRVGRAETRAGCPRRPRGLSAGPGPLVWCGGRSGPPGSPPPPRGTADLRRRVSRLRRGGRPRARLDRRASVSPGCASAGPAAASRGSALGRLRTGAAGSPACRSSRGKLRAKPVASATGSRAFREDQKLGSPGAPWRSLASWEGSDARGGLGLPLVCVLRQLPVRDENHRDPAGRWERTVYCHALRFGSYSPKLGNLFCNTAWPQYSLDSGGKKANRSINYNPILQLNLCCKREIFGNWAFLCASRVLVCVSSTFTEMFPSSRWCC